MKRFCTLLFVALLLVFAYACTPISIIPPVIQPDEDEEVEDTTPEEDEDAGSEDEEFEEEEEVPTPPADDNEDENYTPEIPSEDGDYDGGSADDENTDVVITGDATYWENVQFVNVVNVLYDGSSAVVTSTNDNVASYVTGADVTLDLAEVGATEIIAAGSSSCGQIKIYGDKPVKLTLNGLSLTSDKSAAINVQNKSTLYLHMNPGTENVICDAASQSDEAYYPEGVVAKDEKRNGAVYAKGSIVVSGTGSLEVTGRKKHGFSVKSSMTVRPGATIVIPEVADNCIKAEGVTILGGYLWANTPAEAGKCISSDADVVIEGGELNLYTSGGSIYDEDENDTSSAAGIKADGNVVIKGGDILCSSSGDGGKGINVDGTLTIDGGDIDILTSGGKYVYNAAQDLDSSPKGVKADGEIFINGGSLNIQVTGRSDGSEGLESKTKITVNDGEIFVYAYDDAINVGGDNPVGIEINGGRLFAYADNNDGIDSNAMMWINGGLVIASGSAAPEEGLDCDRSQNFIVTGGTLIGTGGAAVSTSTSSTQRSVIYNGVKGENGELFVVADDQGTPILMYKLPRTMNSMAVFFSSPDLAAGATYTVYSGGSLSGNTENWNGWFADGTYTVGTELGTFTSNDINTTVGQGSGPGGGPGGGGHGGGWGPGWWN